MRTTSVLTFVLSGVSRYFLNAFTTRVASRAVNGANRRLGTLGCGFGGGFIRHEHRQLKQQHLGSYPLFSISWVGHCRGGKTSKAVEKFFGRAAISTRGDDEVRTKDNKVSLVVVSDSRRVYIHAHGMHCGRSSGWVTGRGCK